MKVKHVSILILFFLIAEQSKAQEKTAQGWLSKADSVAQNIASDTQLISVETDSVNIEGASEQWTFSYYSSQDLKIYSFLCSDSTVQLISEQVTPQAPNILPENWINSDSALTVAEENGGSDIRFNVTIQHLQGFTVSLSLKLRDIASEKNQTEFPKSCMWIVKYEWIPNFPFEESFEIFFVNDASATDPEKTTFQTSFSLAQKEARLWYAQTKLLQIYSDDLDLNGKAEDLYYLFTSNDSLCSVFVKNGVVIQSVLRKRSEYGKNRKSMPENWLDSDQALALVETYGGEEIRGLDNNCKINAVLSIMKYVAIHKDQTGYTFSENDTLCWSIDYSTLYPGLSFYSRMKGYNLDAFSKSLFPSMNLTGYLEYTKEKAMQWFSDVFLVEIRGNDVNSQGCADEFSFVFYSASKDSTWNIFFSNGLTSGGHASSYNHYSTEPLLLTFLSLDSLIKIAEENGGKEVRESHMDCKVDITLRSGIPILFAKTNVQSSEYSNSTSYDAGTIHWFVHYSSRIPFKTYYRQYIDAVTGNFAGFSSAQYLISTATSEAQKWATDATLVSIRSQGKFENGVCDRWVYYFYSNKKKSHYQVVTKAGFLESQEEVSFNKKTELPLAWIDSDSAYALAQDNGGQQYLDERKNNTIIILCELETGFDITDTSKTCWHFTYTNFIDSYTVLIDAESGQVLTGIESDNNITNSPTKYQLSQNFPNPFNPTTTIHFTMPQTENVKISIYDITGRHIKTLVNSPLISGTHSIQWNGTNNSGLQVSSGVYFYEIFTDSFTDRKKMMLMR